jgi:hypothetical protein
LLYTVEDQSYQHKTKATPDSSNQQKLHSLITKQSQLEQASWIVSREKQITTDIHPEKNSQAIRTQ